MTRPSTLREAGLRCRYLHSEIDAIERVVILKSLRLGDFDVLVDVNLLREGLDLPEVSLVAMLDADKEGFLRSQSSLSRLVSVVISTRSPFATRAWHSWSRFSTWPTVERISIGGSTSPVGRMICSTLCPLDFCSS